MNEPHDPNRTVDVPSVPADSLDAGLAAAFGKAAGPRSSLDASQRPVLLHEAKGESDHVVKPYSDAMPERGETGDRYQLFGEIARGGMGAVLRGRDVDLGRDLAIKVLLEKHADNPAVARRFLEEAQIGGQLQHPGVVPVYDIGRFGERPFFTMKLVKGKTLQALLAERNVGPVCNRPEMTTAGCKPAPQDLPRLLSIALQVANTLAYAHAKGVIHRDLKPANIMVGAFGEVQVMDWGLAKVLAERGIADEESASRERERPEDGTLIRTARSSGSAGTFGTQTEAGSLLGTPAYMPPEQANGDVALLDRRADVFGLGAVLCEILTGKPPYVGRSYEEVRRKAANGDVADACARLDACGADMELISLTTACLSPEAMDRPKDARAVAHALTAYLDGVQERLHQAELAETAARARAVEEAKRRRLTLALAGTVLLAVTLGGTGWLWLKSERDARKTQLTRDVNEALNQATALWEQAKRANVGSAALFAQAREQAQRALALVENGPAEQDLKAQVTQLQTMLDEEEKDRWLMAAFDAARLAQADTLIEENRFAHERALPLFRAAFRAYGLPAGECEPEIAAALFRQRPIPVREAVNAVLDEWIGLATNTPSKIVEPHLDWLKAVAAAIEPDDDWTRALRIARAKKDPTERKAALGKLAAAADVRKLSASVLTSLANQLSVVEAETSATQLLRKAQEQYPADFWVNEYLGERSLRATPPNLAEAVRFRTVAVALRPDSPGAHLNLGNALKAMGRLDESVACQRKAIELDPKYATAHYNLGNALKAMGQVDEAIACYHKAIALNPKDTAAHTNLGHALYGKGQLDEAIACYRKAIELDPTNVTTHYNLGLTLYAKGQVDGAIGCYRKAIELDPKYTAAHANLGHALRATGRLDEAAACYRKAVELHPKDALAYLNLGNALSATGRLHEAVACFRKAIALDPKNALGHYNLGNALYGKGQMDDAIDCYHKAIALDPKYANAHNNLGNALRDKGQLDEAIACLTKAIALDPKNAGAHANLGLALAGKGQVDEAIACLKKAIALDPKFALAHYNLGNALGDKGQVDEAIACFKKAIALEPKHVNTHIALGNALAATGRADEAIVCYRKAIELDPKDATGHGNLGAVLCDAKRDYDGAIRCFRKAIALDPKLVRLHSNLGNALASKGKLDEAIACYKAAIALDPKLAQAHGALGQALLSRGCYAEARDASAQALALLPVSSPLRQIASRQLQECRRLLKLEARLPSILRGEGQPALARESLDLAQMCAHKKLHAAAASFSVRAFADDPKLADDLKARYRYKAACFAALAAAGQGEDAGKLDAKERARLRKLALDWLRADLAQYTKRLDSGTRAVRRIVQQQMQHWQKDSDLAGIRDQAALDKLPAEERAACTQLWADVAALLKKAETPAKKETKS